MHKLYFVKAGGRRSLDFGALHRRPRHEGRDEFRAHRRRAESDSGRDIQRNPDHRLASTGKNCLCLYLRRIFCYLTELGGCDASTESCFCCKSASNLVSFTYSVARGKHNGIHILLSRPRLTPEVAL